LFKRHVLIQESQLAHLIQLKTQQNFFHLIFSSTVVNGTFAPHRLTLFQGPTVQKKRYRTSLTKNYAWNVYQYLGICSNILSNISDAKLEIDIRAIISSSENKNNYPTCWLNNETDTKSSCFCHFRDFSSGNNTYFATRGHLKVSPRSSCPQGSIYIKQQILSSTF
jgi:hypothetical protein